MISFNFSQRISDAIELFRGTVLFYKQKKKRLYTYLDISNSNILTKILTNIWLFVSITSMSSADFEWDDRKESVNREKHGVSFYEAQKAFLDPNRLIAKDLGHGGTEERFYCFGNVNGGIMTVRFTYRHKKIRIIGAGYWRKGKKIYAQKTT